MSGQHVLERATEFAFESHIIIREATFTDMVGFYARVRTPIGTGWDLRGEWGHPVNRTENTELPGSLCPLNRQK